MKSAFKFVTTAAALAALSSVASAADLPRRSVAPVAPMMAAPFSWTGFYAGANAGYAFSGDDKLGIYGPAYVPTANAGNLGVRGFKGGLFAGYNWQMSNMPIIVGLEADINLSGADRKVSGITAGGTAFAASSKVPWDGSVRARLGYGFDRTLLYVTGGFAFGGNEYKLTTTAPVVTSLSNDDTRAGYTVGAGVDYAFTNNLFGGLEYRYTNLGKKTLTNGVVTTTTTPDWHQVMARIGYKF